MRAIVLVVVLPLAQRCHDVAELNHMTPVMTPSIAGNAPDVNRKMPTVYAKLAGRGLRVHIRQPGRLASEPRRANPKRKSSQIDKVAPR